MKITIKGVITNLFSFFIIAGLVFYLWKHWNIFYTTLEASWFHILSLVLCIFMTLVLNCYQVFLLLRKAGIKVGFAENMFLLNAMILGNYFPMRMGSLLRMHYFKKVHGLQYIRFGGIIGVRTLILLASTGILGFIGMIGLRLSGFPFNVALFSIFVSMVVISLGACLIKFPKTLKSDNILLKVWSDFFSAFEVIQSQPILLWQILGLVLMQFAVLAIRLHISFSAIQVELSPWVFLILAPMTTLISFVSLTPGNLGLREWAIGIVSFTLGIDFHNGIFAGTLDRAILMTVTFIFGSGSLAYVWYRIRNVTSKSKGERKT